MDVASSQSTQWNRPMQPNPTEQMFEGQQQQQSSAQEAMQRQMLMEQVMSLTEDDLMRLPLDRRTQMMQLKAQFTRGY
jgi:hypothetical protein